LLEKTCENSTKKSYLRNRLKFANLDSKGV